MPQSQSNSLRSSLRGASGSCGRRLWAADASVSLSDLAGGSSLGGRLAELRDRSVLVSTDDQLTAALALIELDGLARRLILCPPDLSAEHLAYVSAIAEADAIVSDRDRPQLRECGIALSVICSPVI